MKWGMIPTVLTTFFAGATTMATGQFMATRDTENWQGYAINGGIGGILAVAALFKKPPVTVAAAAEPKAQILAQVEQTLDAAAQRAIVEYGTKLLGEVKQPEAQGK